MITSYLKIRSISKVLNLCTSKLWMTQVSLSFSYHRFSFEIQHLLYLFCLRVQLHHPHHSPDFPSNIRGRGSGTGAERSKEGRENERYVIQKFQNMYICNMKKLTK